MKFPFLNSGFFVNCQYSVCQLYIELLPQNIKQSQDELKPRMSLYIYKNGMALKQICCIYFIYRKALYKVENTDFHEGVTR